MILRASILFLFAAPIWAQAITGEAVYKKRCSGCHDGTTARVPQKSALQKLSAARILRILDFGTMMPVAYHMNRDEREAVAKYLGVPGAASGEPKPEAFCADRAVQLTGAAWNGWSNSPGNTRYQTTGLTLDQTRTLKLKWAYGFDGDVIAFSQPTVIGTTLFVGSASGLVQALDTKSGCIKWIFQADGPVRAALVASGNTLLFGDQIGWFYAVDGRTGKQLWRKKPEPHESTRLTAAAAVHDGIVYVPAASWEETRALNPDYKCCTFRGSVTALRISDGVRLWKTFMIPQAPKRVNAKMIGPSGAGVWATPTIDLKRSIIYATTSDNYSYPATKHSDAVIALRLRDGKMLWSKQMTPNDIFSGFCTRTNDCPGQDFDFGSSAILATTEDGRDLLLAGQKSGVVYALNPDKQGAVVWSQRVGKGGMNGGVQWGMAADGRNVYAATSDVGRTPAPADPVDPKPAPFDSKVGGGLTALRINDGRMEWFTPPAGCAADAKPGCSPAQSAAVTAMPGVIFSSALDGHMRAYAAEDGRILFDFDTVRNFQTVNGVAASGGSIDGPGVVVAGGMVFVNSGYARNGGMAGNVLLAFAPEN